MKSHPLDELWRPAGRTLSDMDLTGTVSRVYGEGAQKLAKEAARKVAAPRQQPGGDFVEALAHGIALLESWQPADCWLTNSQLADRTGLSRPTVSRLSSVLESLGYLTREGKRGPWRLTAATLGLGFGSALTASGSVPAKAELEDLACELDVYAALSIRRLDKVQIIENVASPRHPNAVLNDVGAMLPICRSASGLAALSALSEQEIEQVVLRLKVHYGERWASLDRQIARKRLEYSDKGYCTSVAVLSQNVGAVAVPIVSADGSDIFVLACGMPAHEFYRERIESHIAPRMLEVAQSLNGTLE